MRYGHLAKVGYAGWTAVVAPAGYQVTLPLKDTHASLFPPHTVVCTTFENVPPGLRKFRDHVCYLLEDAIAHLLKF